MSSIKKSLSAHDAHRIPDASGLSFGVVVSLWNEDITGPMAEAAVQTLLHHGTLESNIHRIDVPGAFELPLGARLAAGKHKLDAIICIGCVIRGETSHDAYISQAVANGLVQFGLMSGIPTIFGVLTTNDHQQALDRSGGKHGNKGVEAAVTAIQMAALKQEVREPATRIGFGSL